MTVADKAHRRRQPGTLVIPGQVEPAAIVGPTGGAGLWREPTREAR